MTQQEVNDLANAWDVNDAPISARNLGVLAYEAGFKKALALAMLSTKLAQNIHVLFTVEDILESL